MPDTNEKLREILVAQGRLEEGVALADAQLPTEFTFAGNVAAQVGGADFSEEREKPESDRDKAMASAAKVRDWQANLDQLDFDQRVEATLESWSRRPANRFIMKDLLDYCLTERMVQDAEAHVQQHRSFSTSNQSASQFIFFMKRTGALVEHEYDSDGLLITPEMRQELIDLGATEEELEDLAVEWRLVTTDVGKEALRQDDPLKKARELLAKKVSRKPTYNRVLDFCKEPRSMDEIFQMLQGDPGLEVNAQGIMGCQPSAYVSHLEDAGILVWERGQGWQLTREGKVLVESLAS